MAQHSLERKWLLSEARKKLIAHKYKHEIREFIARIIYQFSSTKEKGILHIGIEEKEVQQLANLEDVSYDYFDLIKQNKKEISLKKHSCVFASCSCLGYLKNLQEIESLVIAISRNLKRDELIILDYINPYKVLKQELNETLLQIPDISFNIESQLENGLIHRFIRCSNDQGETHFEDKLLLLRQMELLKILNLAQVRLLTIYGDYQMNPCEMGTSERMILLAQKL